MFSPPPFGLSLESELLCVGRLSTQSNSLRAPIKEKVFAWAHHLMQNLFHNHHPSPITFHIPLQTFRFLGQSPLFYFIKAFQLQRQVSRVRKEFDCWDRIGSYSKHSITKKNLRGSRDRSSYLQGGLSRQRCTTPSGKGLPSKARREEKNQQKKSLPGRRDSTSGSYSISNSDQEECPFSTDQS